MRTLKQIYWDITQEEKEMNVKNEKDEWQTVSVVIPDYVKRMFKEHDGINKKATKLIEFLRNAEDLPKEKESMMFKQLKVMKEYRAVLDDRINLEMKELSEGVVPQDKDFSIDS